ncbi:MAG: DUF4982 domain-containing protein, partial [Firmicutes bacterium]|nr:DUF4982 domain-containing protein [Bacillota bacterium]
MPKKFNDNWYFRKEVKETSDSAGGSNYVTATDWQPVTIPHDWLISDSNNLYQTSIGYYRKAWDASDLQYGQRAILCFDGVYMDCELFVNSQLVGCWQYGYTAFHFDITDFVNLLDPSNNTIMLKVNYQSPNSRWYTGAGIYRDCFMLIKNSTHFAINGIYITPKRQLNDIWHVNIATEIVSDTKNYTVRHKVDSITEGIKTLPNGDLEFFAPQMWSLFNPACYYIISEIVVNGEVVDKVTTRFGFREIQFDPNKGFFLNGKNVKINGVCQHHDLGALGAAVHPDALRRQLTILKSMGVNAIRTAHNPPAKLFMELCDQMGFLVMSEFTDMWKRPKNKYDYARFFEEHSAKDVAAWIRRDRNCPSIIMWSVGNEIVDTHASYVDGLLTLQELVDNVRKHDPQSHAQITLCSNYMAWENTQKCVDILKLVGYNYAEYLYDDHHKKFPDWIIYGGETASTVQSRGVYHFPLAASVLSDDDLQCSALGNSTTSWGAKNAETCIKDHRDRDFIFGQFIWTGTDYIGEPTPYHTKNSYFGQIDTAGFPKDSYYIFKAGWTDFRRAPFIHILPHWDWSPGQPIDVRVCSNVKQVELFLNDVSLGVKDIDLVADYVVPYESGTLRATAIARNGTIVAEHSRHSFGDTASLQLTNTTIGELIFTEITAVDENGNIVENANNRVILSLIEGELLGTDNGDSTDRESYQQADRRLFNGKLLAISKPNSVTDGTFEIYADLDDYDIPVRKIELTNVSKSEKEFEISAELFPKTATPQNIRQLQWRLTDANGIDSPLGTLEVAADGLSAKILPKGDGEAYVRCGVTNGNSHLSIISVFPINITGFGKPFLNPYDFVAGGLYN